MLISGLMSQHALYCTDDDCDCEDLGVCVWGTLVCGCIHAEFVCALHEWSLLLITGHRLVIFLFFKKRAIYTFCVL